MTVSDAEAVDRLRRAEALAKEKTDVGALAFGMVIEAKMATMVSMAEGRGYTKNDWVGFAERMWDKYAIGAGKGLPKK